MSIHVRECNVMKKMKVQILSEEKTDPRPQTPDRVHARTPTPENLLPPHVDVPTYAMDTD